MLSFEPPITLSDGTVVQGIVNAPAIFVVCAVSLLLMHGISKSARINAIITVIKVAIIVTFIGIGFFYIDTANYSPFIPENTGEYGDFGTSGILRAAGIVFFSYLGFNVISTAAQEVKNPQRNMPIGIIGSLVICTVIYLAFSMVLVGMVNYEDMVGDAAPVATAINQTPYPILQVLIKVGIIAGFTSVILVSLLGQSRVARAMSADGFLPKSFGSIHANWKTPWRLHIGFMLLVSPFAGFVPISKLAEMTSIGTLFAFIVVCLAVLILRRLRPDLPRRFRVPLYPYIPLAGIAMCLIMMASLHAETWLRFAAWMFIGIVIYFVYSRKNIRKLEAQQQSATNTNAVEPS